MAIRAVPTTSAPAPKARCPGCRRPVALLRSDRCVYCGRELPGRPQAADPASPIPAEALIALEPRPRPVSTGSKWLRRMIALGVAGLLTALMLGHCGPR